MSVQALAAQLQAAQTPAEQVTAALNLLHATHSRQYVDEALHVLTHEALLPYLNDTHRPILRQKALYYFQAPPQQDKAGLIREKITRLLVHIGNPADVDVYLLGVNTYYLQPVTDVAQNLRAAALAGLSRVDDRLACWYAAKLLGEDDTSVFNGQPAITALEVLKQANQSLPIYQFLLLGGLRLSQQGKGEVVAQAFESLDASLPDNLLRHLAELYLSADAPQACMGLVTALIATQRTELYDLIERILTDTQHEDLHRATALTLAASGRDTLIALLYRLAKFAPPERIPNYCEAVELTQHPERDTLLAMLYKRR